MRRRLMSAAAVATVTVALLAGCAANPYPAETAEALQQKVLTVSQTAAAGDLAGARAQLDELQASIDDARESDVLTADRHDDIATAIALVRSDLDAAIAQQAQQAAEAAAEAARLEQEEALREQQEAQRQQEEAQRQLQEQQNDGDDDEKEEKEKEEKEKGGGGKGEGKND